MILDLEDWLRANNYDIDSIPDKQWVEMEDMQDELETTYINDEEDNLFRELLSMFSVAKIKKSGDQK